MHLQLAFLRSAGAPALIKYCASLPYISLAGPLHLCTFSTLPYGGKDSDEHTVSKDAIRNEAAKEAQEGEGPYLEPHLAQGANVSSRQHVPPQTAGIDALRNPDMQSKPGDLAQPTAAEAAKQQDEFSVPQMNMDRPEDMPEGTVPPTRGFDQSGTPSRNSPTRGEGIVERGPGTSAGTTGAL